MRTEAVAAEPAFGADDVGGLLLRICAAPDADHGAAFAALTAEQWSALADMAAQRRTAPLLQRCMNRAFGASGQPAALPPAVAAAIDAETKWHALYGMRQAVGLVRLVQVLADAGLQPILLKGVALAYRDYPAPALRPLRDVDLLLGEADAVMAQNLLIAHPGYRLAPWAGQYGVEHGHQLPELQDIETELTIEVHHRINARGWTEEPKLLRKIYAEAESIKVLGRTVRVPSVHANLLHLVEHATLHHTFDNGPLILADMHYLVSGHAIDWPRLLDEARDMGLANALGLVAGFARDHGAVWVPEELSGLCDQAARFLPVSRAALLRDDQVSQQTGLLRRLARNTGEVPNWTGALRRAFHPNPYQLAKIAGTRTDNPLRWMAYPAWLARRGALYVAAMRAERQSRGAAGELQMLQWLDEG